jgi:hypothetical protein
MVSGWFGSSPEQQYQIKALSTVAGVRGTEFIVQINGEGKNASAFFATITGTVVLWNVDRPEQKLTLPADFFIEVLNGGVPGGKQSMGPEIFEQFNQGFFVIEARGLRGEIILQVVQFNISMPSGPGGPVVINVIPMPGAESNRNDYLSPTDSLLTGNVIPPTGGGGGGGGGGIIIPPGNTSVQIKIDPSDLNR